MLVLVICVNLVTLNEISTDYFENESKAVEYSGNTMRDNKEVFCYDFIQSIKNTDNNSPLEEDSKNE